MRASPVRGEVWRADLEPTRGDEMRKTRPAVVISDEGIGKLALRIVVPVTEWKDPFEAAPWMVRLDPEAGNGLDKTSAADGFQVRSVSVERLRERLGALGPAKVDAIAQAVALCIGYRPDR